MDLKEAYRSVPVHPTDRPLPVVQWQGTTFLDGALPFGLRSAPKLFKAIADGLLWIFLKEGIQPAIHYLDDFLFFGPPGKPACHKALQKALQICEELVVLVAPEKMEGSVTSITFLGIEIDSQAYQLHLPKQETGGADSHLAVMDANRQTTQAKAQGDKEKPSLPNWKTAPCLPCCQAREGFYPKLD